MSVKAKRPASATSSSVTILGCQAKNVANLDAFAGPTASISSNAVKACFTLVAARAAIDFAGLVAAVDLQIVSIAYNLDETTFVTKTVYRDDQLWRNRH
ncbi:MAG: hypothetical protein MZU97_16820 [Bacillus subtilis]|nr:hypothetical protein [Bacillus subtilis]